MVRRNEEFPPRGELVVGTVKEVNPNSVFVQLDEYGKKGMIHISEIAKKWVRDIRNWVNLDEKIVCKVKDVRKDEGQIDLSLKDVSDRNKNRRMQSWKRDERGEDFLKKLAESKDLSMDEIYEEIGFSLQENFKDMLEPFEIAVRKGVEELEKRGLDQEWAEELKKTGEKNLKIKMEEVKGRFTLRTWEPDGIELIRKSLLDVEEKSGVDFKYISAPEYEIVKEVKDLKRGEEVLEESIEELRRKFEGKDAEIESHFR
ncbi:MAG: S1 RNA-binding domain-containing protein [Candidatus Aenigmatarchaeota archaeon]